MVLVAQGDDQALRQLVDRHHPRLVGYLKSEVGSQTTAEELAMEVFIRLHRAASRWRPEAKLSTYQRELVKIYADYKLDVKLAAKITLKSQK